MPSDPARLAADKNDLREPRPQDHEAIDALMRGVRTGDAEMPPVERRWRGNFTQRYDPDRNAFCVLLFYEIKTPHPILPFTRTASLDDPVWASQVSELLPQEEGRFSDGSLGILLLETLREHARRFPDALGQPVFAFLDATPGPRGEPSTVEKWQTYFGARVERPRSGHAAIWLPTLAEAIR